MRKLFLVLVILLAIIAVASVCARNHYEETATAKRWSVKLLDLEEFLTQLESSILMEPEAQKIWQQTVTVGYFEMSRLLQGGYDVSLLPKPTPKNVDGIISDLSGEYIHRIVLSFWLLQETEPLPVLYVVGTSKQGIKAGRVQFLARLMGPDGAPSIRHFGAEPDFIPLALIRWDRDLERFDIAVDEKAIHEITVIAMKSTVS